jgi:hypothetical protein
VKSIGEVIRGIILLVVLALRGNNTGTFEIVPKPVVGVLPEEDSDGWQARCFHLLMASE